MAYFKHICLVEAPQTIIVPFPRFITDCIAVCYLAAAVEHDVESLVMPDNFYNYGIFDSLRSLLKKSPVDLVAISSMTGAFNQAERLARIAKEAGKFVVMGGFHPTALPEEVLKLSCVDVVVIGEGEETFRELVLKGPSRDVKGIAYREGGGIVFTGQRDIIADIDSIRFPMRSLRPDRYGEKGDAYSIDTIYTSRGCPWSCSFCANDQMHKSWRGRSAENVVEEIALLHDPNNKKLLKIWDANFLTNIGRAEKICDMMIERGLTNFRIMTESRAKDLVRAERILDKLRRIGLSKVGLGIESPSEATLALMNKKNSLDDVARAIELCNKNKIGAEGYFIIGHYTENVQDTIAYPEFARSLGLRQALFMVMTPYPGTGIFKEYKDEGKIRSFDWDLYNNYCPVIETRSMDSGTLIAMLAYCNVSFNRYKSAMKRNTTNAVLINFLIDLFQLTWLMRVNKNLSDKEIQELLYNALLMFLDNKKGEIEQPAASTCKTLQQPIQLRIRHTADKCIDYNLSERAGNRVLTMTTQHSNRPIAGPEIRLDKLIECACAVPMDKLMSLLYRNEWMRNNPGRMTGFLLSILTDGEVIGFALKISRLFLGSIISWRK
ncbi:MAG: B12-binding domain-containing radical SAM protein [Chlorobiaceae bacterium]|nr:B12-binding domain-containing radical SAM protein [Chlorobiaceae bacterium]